MTRLQFKLNISREDYLHHYQGLAQEVIARTQDGQTIRFPASLLRQHIRHDGIHGLFEICFDENFKCQELRGPL